MTSEEFKALRGKANGIIHAIEAMTARQKDEIPQAPFCEDYNRLRKMVHAAIPQQEKYFPPVVTIQPGAQPGVKIPDARYGEILSYSLQLRDLLVNNRPIGAEWA